jgi:hypothetical protein
MGRDILNYADKIGLKIIMGTGGQTAVLEYTPGFVMKDKYYVADDRGYWEDRNRGYEYLNCFYPDVDSLVKRQYIEVAETDKDYPLTPLI